MSKSSSLFFIISDLENSKATQFHYNTTRLIQKMSELFMSYPFAEVGDALIPTFDWMVDNEWIAGGMHRGEVGSYYMTPKGEEEFPQMQRQMKGKNDHPTEVTL